MTTHYVSDTNPVHVVRADSYRVSHMDVLTPEHPRYADMQEHINEEHRRDGGYGLAFLESEEHSLMYVGPVEQIEEARTTGVPLDVTRGVSYDRWPHGDGWGELIPANTWHPGGEGILAEFDHPAGGKVVVYEYLDDGQQPMVAFHCDHCHPAEHGQSRPSSGPHNRRWTAREARSHVRSAERHGVGTDRSSCRPMNPAWAEVVQQVANRELGTNNPATSWASQCATTGPCSTIRHLRACQ